jgi:hypothetical protein
LNTSPARRLDPVERGTHGAHQVVDPEEVAHLVAVAVHRDRRTREERAGEVRHPPLILRAELARP